tara:strand:- start:300 stop:2054 length:1755 start_codon:yes stop_codon:yes gene_type:complete
MKIFNKHKVLFSLINFHDIAKIGVLIIIGMILEMLGLGIILPVISAVADPEILLGIEILSPIHDFIRNSSVQKITTYGLLILVFTYVFKSSFLIFSIWRQTIFASNLCAKISKNLFEGYLNLNYSFHININSSILMRNVQSEVEVFAGLVQSIIFLLSEFTILIGLVIVLLLVDPFITLFILTFISIIGVLFYFLTKKKLLKWGNIRQNFAAKIKNNLLQGFGGIKDVKIFGKEFFFVNKFNFNVINYHKNNAKYTTLYQSPRLYLELIAVCGLSGILIIYVSSGNSILTILPTLAVFVAAAFRMIPSLNRILASIQTLIYSKPVVTLLNSELSKVNVTNPDYSILKKLIFKNSIEFKNLSFNYPLNENKVLDSINFKIDRGTNFGIIGESGSGKSTIVDLLLGLLDSKDHEIIIDGKPLNKIKTSFKSIVGYVPQTIFLTDNSIRRNIAFGIKENEIDNEKINKVVRLSKIDKFIDSQKNGLDTIVGERGVRLSGGQKQRIGLARALYNNPQILILDEATSALDNKIEKEIMNLIYDLNTIETKIIIAHRLSTISKCDFIIKIDNGKIIDFDTAENILKNEEN